MDSNTYFQLLQYLTDFSLPNYIDELQKKSIIKKSRFFIVIDGQLFKKNKREPTRPLKVAKRNEVDIILYNVHSDPLAGHFGIKETFRRVALRYYWPQYYEDVRDYVKSCDECQKRGTAKRSEPLHPIKVGQPFEQVGMDIVGPLPMTKKGYTHIVVATDYLTKWPEARAIINAKASSVVTFFYEDLICRHGCPKVLLTDRGTHFVNEMLDSLCREIGIKHKLSTAYHPQTNGLVERFNRTLCETLAKFANQNKDDWDIYIPSALFAYRTMRQETTRHEPFYLTYGRDVTLPVDFLVPSINEVSNMVNLQENLLRRTYVIIGRLQDDRRVAQKNIRISQKKQKERFDDRLKGVDEYEKGDLVLLYRSGLGTRKKLEERWKGPYVIHENLGNGAYRLKATDGKVLKDPVNGERLKLYFQKSRSVIKE